MYARVAFPLPYESYYTYKIPDGLGTHIVRGMIVVAPLGKKPAVGVVLEVVRESGLPGIALKEISALGDPELTVPEDLLTLVEYTAGRYGTTPGMVFKSALPPGTLQRRKLYLYPGKQSIPQDCPREAREFLAKVAANAGRIAYSDIKRLKIISLKTLDSLIQAGILSVSPFKALRIAGSKKRWVKATGKTIPENLRNGTKAYHLLEKLIGSDECISTAVLKDQGFSAAAIATLHRKGLVEFEFRDREIEDIGRMESLVQEKIFELTLWQRAILERVEASLNAGSYTGFLLYGVTSSGKTQVYLEAARLALSRGKSVLVMVPEISLTPQIVSRFERSAGVSPLVWHSHLTPTERALVYKRARSGEARLIIGARSSIYSPLKKLGLIVVDEEQDNSYKQDDPAPRYNARELAIEKGRLTGATVILGSATPSAEAYYAAKEGKLKLHTLPQRVAGKRLPRIEIISTASREGDRPKTRPVFPHGFWPVSERMHTELSIRLKNKEQVIVLLNRRGYSSSVICFDCGWLGKCPDCEIGWTYHKARNRMICHYCGKEMPGPTVCPNCGSARLSFRGAGTERLEESLKNLFPAARIKRLDSDTATGKWESRDILDEFGKGKIDILLGTQMVAKGHHFPAVGFVGVIGADVGLSLPDFRASERVLQLLTQAAGRAGRSSKKTVTGLVMVQSFAPENPLFEYLLKDDYTGFLENELRIRRALKYPPFTNLILIEVSSTEPARALAGASGIKDEVCGNFKEKPFDVLGPAKSAIFKKGKLYRYQILLKLPTDYEFGGLNDRITSMVKCSRGFSVRIDIDPVNFT